MTDNNTSKFYTGEINDPVTYKIYTGEFNDPVSTRTNDKFKDLSFDEYHDYIKNHQCDSIYDTKNQVKCIYPSSNTATYKRIDYTNITTDFKTYMVTNYNCKNCYFYDKCKNCVDCLWCQTCENCDTATRCSFCNNCANTVFCIRCYDCDLCHRCAGIQHCTGLIDTTLCSPYLSDNCKVKLSELSF